MKDKEEQTGNKTVMNILHSFFHRRKTLVLILPRKMDKWGKDHCANMQCHFGLKKKKDIYDLVSGT